MSECNDMYISSRITCNSSSYLCLDGGRGSCFLFVLLHCVGNEGRFGYYWVLFFVALRGKIGMIWILLGFMVSVNWVGSDGGGWIPCCYMILFTCIEQGGRDI